MMADPTPLEHRTIALVLACLLSSMALLGTTSSPPTVSILDIPKLEDGMRVQVDGMLVAIWTYESGVESLILSDLDGSASVKIISSRGLRPQPSQYADIGDEMRVIGEISNNGLSPTVFSRSDDIQVSLDSEKVLTVDILSTSWELFEGDCIRITGILGQDGFSSAPRLYSQGMNHSVALLTGGLDFGRLIASKVVVTGTLHFDSRTMTLVLVVVSIGPDS